MTDIHITCNRLGCQWWAVDEARDSETPESLVIDCGGDCMNPDEDAGV